MIRYIYRRRLRECLRSNNNRRLIIIDTLDQSIVYDLITSSTHHKDYWQVRREFKRLCAILNDEDNSYRKSLMEL
jgi:hypothetical protein